MTVTLRVQPRARRTALAPGSGGVLKAAVTAPPESGRANDAVIGLLATAWRVPKSAIAVAKGMGGRDKVVALNGEPGELAERIGEWVRAHG